MSASTSTPTSTCISMASRNRNPVVFPALLLLAAAPVVGQTPSAVRLSFADVVRRAAAEAPAVALAGLRTDEAEARVRQARSALLPGFSVGAGWLTRTFNSKTLGIEFPPPAPRLPTIIGPFDNVDARL